MVIVSAQTPAPRHSWRKPLLTVGILSLLGSLAVPVGAAIFSQQAPTGSYLSPLPETQVAQAPTPTQNQLTAEQAILSSQAYLEKAIALSRTAVQEQPDKDQIVAYLNQSLELANQAVSLAPNQPQAYLMRARVLSSSVNLRSDAIILAQKDLEAAQAMANGQIITLPTEVDLLQLAPTQRAEAGSRLVIASPEESQVKESSGSAESNTDKARQEIGANELELEIKNPLLTADSYVYLISEQPGRLVYLKSKTEGRMIVATDAPAATPLGFEYWIINP
jgi:hypothetical protein